MNPHKIKIRSMSIEKFIIPASCTINEIVFKLLGWIPQEIRCGDLKESEPESSRNFPQIPPYFDESYFSFDSPRLEALDNELYALEKTNVSSEKIKEKYAEISKFQKENQKGLSYICEIKKELDRDNFSELRIAHRATMKHNILCIYRRDVNLWAQKKYGCFAFDYPEDTEANEISNTQEESQTVETSYEGGLGKLKADNVFTMLGYLVDEYCKLGPSTLRISGKPNAKQIGLHFEELVTADNNMNPISGMDHETIRKVVTEARKRRTEKIKGK